MADHDRKISTQKELPPVRSGEGSNPVPLQASERGEDHQFAKQTAVHELDSSKLNAGRIRAHSVLSTVHCCQRHFSMEQWKEALPG